MTRLPATRYRIVPRDVNAHLFEVSCAVDAPDPAGQRLWLPTWVPGSYLIREFARHFVSVRPAASTLGVKLAGQGEAKLMHVFAGGRAAKAGRAGGDVLIAVNGLRVDAASFDALIERSSPGERVTMHAFCRDELMSFEVTLELAPPDTAFLTLDPDATPEAIARRQAWLGTAPD